jgi:hypothetical protein
MRARDPEERVPIYTQKLAPSSEVDRGMQSGS